MTSSMENSFATPPNNEPLTGVFNRINDWDKAKTIEKCITDKLPNADKTRIDAYRSALEKLLPYRTSFENLLAKIDNPTVFCRRKLQEELRIRYGTQFRVGDKIRLKPKASSKRGKHVYTLLQAAMLNFSSAEAAADHFSTDSETLADLSDAPAEGSTDSKITAHSFAALSRNLDLGNEYQKYVSHILRVSSVRLHAEQLARLDMKLAAYTRYFSDAIHQSVLLMLTQLVDGHKDILNGSTFNNSPVQLYSVQLFRKYVVDAVLIVCRLTNESTKDRYFLYVPEDPGSIFYQDDDEDNCRIRLAANMIGPTSLRELFASGLNQSDQEEFLKKNLHDISITEDISFSPLTQGLFNYLFTRKVNKFLSDAKRVAAPKADIDQSIDSNRRENTVLQQRPALSETVLYDFSQRIRRSAVDALLSEVFTGVEDWSCSNKHTALNKLLDIKETLASEEVCDSSCTAKNVLADYFKEFEIEDHANAHKNNDLLWRRALAGYEQRAQVENRVNDLADSDQDDHRVLNFNGMHFIRIDGRIYEVERNPLAWRIRHPLTGSAYRPPVVYSPGSGWSLQHKQAVTRRPE